MQENNPMKAETGAGQKPGGLSWSQSAGNQNTNSNNSSVQKPIQMPGSLPKTTPQKPPASGEQKSGSKTLMWMFAGGIIIGVIVGWMWFGTQQSAVPTDSATAGDVSSSDSTLLGGASNNVDRDTATSAGAVISSEWLAVPSPQTAGLQVAISHVSVTRPTWVVVYESRGGQPGNALGASLFFDSTQNSGVVDLLRGTLPGQMYFVGESIDDGDRIFSLQNDKPVRDQSGNPLWVTFKTQ